MVLHEGKTNIEYTIAGIQTTEDGMKEFLFSLGCYPGEKLTIISRLASNFVISVKNARYSIDEALASAISINAPSSEGQLIQKVG